MTLPFIADGLANVMSGAGTSVDKRVHQFYAARPLDWQQIDAMYRSSWAARKIVDLPAAEMARPKRDWQAKEGSIEALEELERKVRLWAKLEEALRLGRMGGGVMVIGVKQGKPDQSLNVGALGAGCLSYLHVMSRWEVNAGEIDRDPASENFGCPLYYEIQGQADYVRIHPSRVIPFCGEYTPRLNGDHNAFWGVSILEIVRDAIQNADSAQNGFATLIEEASIDVLGIPDMTNSLVNPEYEQRLIRRLTLANTSKSTHRALIKDAAETWEQHQTSFAGMPEVIASYIGVLAGAASMPATVLLGKSPDGMNATGDGDMQNWYRTLDGWRESELRPALDRLDPILKAHAGVTGDAWWEFGSFYEESDSVKVEKIKGVAEAASTAINAGMPSEPVLNSLGNAMSESGLFPGLDEGLAQIKAELAEMPSLSEQAANEAAAQTAEREDAALALGDAAPRPLYVSRKVVNVSDLRTWARTQGLPDLQDDLHVTVAFSRQPVDWIKMGQDYRDFSNNGKGELVIAAGGPRVVEPLGDRTAVLLFANSDLAWRNREMIDAGASWDYDDYQPHISLTGDPVDLSTVEPYRGKIVLGPEIFEDLNLD